MGSKIAFVFLLISVTLSSTQGSVFNWKNSVLNSYSKESSIDLEKDLLCNENGFFCIGCTTSLYCYQTPTGDWIRDTKLCSIRESCVRNEYRCAPPGCISELKYKMKCYQVGLFPHPYEPTYYYHCDESAIKTGEEPPVIECEEGLAFDSLTSFCQREITDAIHDIVLGTCVNIGTSGGIKGNPFLYYTCLPTEFDVEDVRIIPHLFRCDANERYIEGSQCTPKPEGLKAGSKCPTDGSFSHETDCWKFYYCTDAGEDPQLVSCPAGKSYDAWNKQCVPMDCTI